MELNDMLLIMNIIGTSVLFFTCLYLFVKVYLFERVLQTFARQDNEFKTALNKNKMTVMNTPMGPVLVPETVMAEGVKQKTEEMQAQTGKKSSKKEQKPSYLG